MPLRKYSEEEKLFLKGIIPGRHYEEILSLFNAKFDVPITLANLASFIGNNKVNTGLTGRFQKGQTPHNKGKSFYAGGRSAETRFKKGSMPGNYRPMGSTRVSKDGYTEIKVADPRKWKHLHRVIWEKEHGPIPKGHVVIFGDGNKTNICIENLLLISRGELAVLNKCKLLGASPEITKIGIMVANVKQKLRKRIEGKKKRCKKKA